jgi:hypothetical protein
MIFFFGYKANQSKKKSKVEKERQRKTNHGGKRFQPRQINITQV